MKLINIGFVSVALVLAGCDNSNVPGPVRARIGRDMNELYDPHRGSPQPINWVMIPGGGVSDVSTASKYCVVLDMQSKDFDTIAAFVCSETSDVLFMLLTYEGGNDTVCHLDTDGYTPYLELSRKAKDEQFRLYLEIHRGKREVFFVADLPPLAGLRTQDLALRKVESIPIWGDTRAATRADFSPTVGIPAVMRIQGNEKTLYTYHVRQSR